MRGRAIIPLVIGLGLGIFAVKMFFGVLKNAKGANHSETVEIVCAAADIPPAVEIGPGLVVTRTVPKALMPKQSFQKVEDVAGRVSSVIIPSGSAIVPSLLAPVGTPPGLAVRIPD